jgi:hypothetical protein
MDVLGSRVFKGLDLVADEATNNVIELNVFAEVMDVTLSAS